MLKEIELIHVGEVLTDRSKIYIFNAYFSKVSVEFYIMHEIASKNLFATFGYSG